MRKKVYEKILGYEWAGVFLALAVFGFLMAVSDVPNPASKIEDFAVVNDTITQAKIIEGTWFSLRGGPSKFYDLQVLTGSNQMFHLHRPATSGQLNRYLAALPIGQEVVIHYFYRSGDRQICDIRNKNEVFIPFSEIMADEDHKRNFMFMWSGIFVVIGTADLLWQRRKQNRKNNNK